MKLLSLSLIFILSAQAVSAKTINEELTVNYGYEAILELQFAVAKKNIVNFAKNDLECTKTKFTYKIIKKTVVRAIGNDTPGQVKFNLSANCADSVVSELKFYFEPGFYDEDWGAFKYKAELANGFRVEGAGGVRAEDLEIGTWPTHIPMNNLWSQSVN
jgi:hypothetical protein